MNIPQDLQDIIDALISVGARPYLVGGCVRDHLLGIAPHDFDIEVFNMYPEQLLHCLKYFGAVNEIGKAFGILQVRGYEFSVPRKDNKTGAGHKGFSVSFDPNISIEEACSRRDFTINSMMYDPQTNQILDPYHGKDDLRVRLLSPTSSAFKEDPLRVLRGFQFAARFNMVADNYLCDYAEEIKDEYKHLPKERVWAEWKKWAEQGLFPSAGLDLLVVTTWIDLYPELKALINCAQEPEWHPEGSVFVHTLLVCDAMAEICKWNNIAGEDRVVLMLAALCHDLGKPQTTFTREDGRIVSPGHAEIGVEISRHFLNSIGCFPRIIERVLPLVKEHLAHIQKDISKRTVRRLANRLYPATIKELSYLAEADHSGRHPLPGGMPEGIKEILKISKEIQLTAAQPKPFITGKDLIARGIEPGKTMGKILAELFESQLDGLFTDRVEALNYLDSVMFEDL